MIDVQKNNRVLDQSVQNAINTLSTMDAAILNDSAKINDAFMKIIGIEYASLFQECGPVILAQAKMRIGNDMSAWDTSDLPTLLGLLKNAQKEKAKKEKIRMTISQVIDKLNKEKQEGIPSRFPCRAIMVKNVQQYCELLSELQKIPDIVKVSPAELFSSADVMPQYINLTASQYANQWVILTGVSEYLRLFGKSESVNNRFSSLWSHQVPATSRGRIIIPLWGCEAQWHDHSLHLCEDERQDDFYMKCFSADDEEEKLNFLVMSGAFEQYISQLSAQSAHMLVGLRDWYDYWANPSSTSNTILLLTKRYVSIQPTEGNISIRVIQDTFSFLQENLKDGHTLTKDTCPPEAQNILFEYSLAGKTLDDAILSALNMAQFNEIDVMSKWPVLSEGQKQLVSLWLKRHPENSYLYHCIQASTNLQDIPEHVLHDIFHLRSSHPEWDNDSQRLVSAMKLQKDSIFFSELDKIAVYEERLKFLSGGSKEEKVYLLHMIGKWMREDANQVRNCELLEKTYPALYAYLGGKTYDSDLSRYFALYKSHKLENSLPTDEELYFSGIRTDSYDYRYALLSESVTDDCIVLWIDALGAEWLPLLVWSLEQNQNGKIAGISIAQATLPTETCFNEQWKQMNAPHMKLDRLDKLAHKGVVDVPDYYACIEQQLSFVGGLAARVDELLASYHRVIITGDHGTSRLAARFFHKSDGMNPPQGATACSHGRYCKLTAPAIAQTYQTIAKDSAGCQYLVFTNYDHFTQSGFAAGADDENAIYGEVHGGATPEEMLVPVVVYDSIKEKPLTAQWQKSEVKIMMKKAKPVLKFSRPVHSLQVKLGSYEGKCTPSSDKKQWTIEFPGIAPNTYAASIAADGVLVVTEPLKILSALGGGDGDLP